MSKSRSVIFRLVLGLACLVAMPAWSGTVYTLNFDTDFNNNAIASGTLVNTAYSIPGVTFGADDVILVGGGGETSPPNFATGSPNNFSSFFDVFFSIDANEIQAQNVTNSAWTLTVFDINDNVLGSVSVSGFPQLGSLSFPGQIRRAQFSTQSQYGIDDLSFDVVPEPSSFLLLGGALGLVLIRRFRR